MSRGKRRDRICDVRRLVGVSEKASVASASGD